MPPPYESAPPPSPCVEPPDFKWGADDDQPLHEPSRFGFSQDSTPGPAGPSGANYRSRLFDFPGSPDASSVVFVCDASGSILNKMATLEDELQRAVDGLVPVQSFNIVFTEPSRCMALDPNGLLPATAANKQKALHFTDNVTTTGTPDPAFALAFPFGLRPDLIYLVTDGDFPDNRAVLAQVRQLNSSKAVKLNTLAFVNDADTDTEFITLLRQLADENGGAYRRVSESAIVQ